MRLTPRRHTTTLTATTVACLILATTPTATANADTMHAGDTIHLTNPNNGVRTSCTLGPVVSKRTATTAAHCGADGATIENDAGTTVGKRGTAYPGVDVATIHIRPPHKAVPTPISDTPMQVGDQVYQTGARSGKASGEVTKTGVSVDLQGTTTELGSSGGPIGTTGAIVAMDVAVGDSGAPVWRDGEVVGMVSAMGAEEKAQGVTGDRATVTNVVGVL